MACPSCGGSDRISVAPGFWECCSQLAERRPGRVPDPMGPAGATMPITDIIYRTCGVRYHEAAGSGVTLLCECSTFAIGVCGECMKPVCGDHSRLLDGQRLCISHVRAKEEAAAKAAREAWLTPEKFLALAEAAGNPWLRSWTIRIKGQVAYQFKKAPLARAETRYREEVVGTYEMRGWTLYDKDAVITDDGRVHGFLRGAPRDGESQPGMSEIDTVDESQLKFDDPHWGTVFYRGEGNFTAQDKDHVLRQTCASLRIPITN